MIRNTVVRIALALVCLATLALPLAGQQAKTAPGIPGYLDPQTGSFKPAPAALHAVEDNAAAVVYKHGTLVFNFTITVASTLPASSTIYCTGTAETYNYTTNAGMIMETATVTATRNNGTASCKVTIPYSWNEALAGSTVNLSYAINALTSTGTGTVIFATGSGAARSSSQSIGSIPLPAVGATTTETITATI
jgi:hypothetical protein